MRAVGLDETSARRLGTNTGRVVFSAFVVCSLMAAVAGFFSASLIQTGSPIIGGYALQSIVAAVLGGASLAGGRGSFVGAVLAALFLSLILNVLPLLKQPTEYGADRDRRSHAARADRLPGARAVAPAPRLRRRPPYRASG